VQLNQYTGALPGTGSAQTPQKIGDQSIPAASFTAEVNGTSAGTLAFSGPQWYVQPFGGVLDIQYPLHRELGLDAAGTVGTWTLLATNGPIAYPYAGYAIVEET
jgi:hypothetical protein